MTYPTVIIANLMQLLAVAFLGFLKGGGKIEKNETTFFLTHKKCISTAHLNHLKFSPKNSPPKGAGASPKLFEKSKMGGHHRQFSQQ